MCGYTDADLDTVFAAELPGLDRAEIRDWYNGYNWRGEERVYNPFDILRLFERREFGAWWFETGTPAFLIDHVDGAGRGITPATPGHDHPGDRNRSPGRCTVLHVLRSDLSIGRRRTFRSAGTEPLNQPTDDTRLT